MITTIDDYAQHKVQYMRHQAFKKELKKKFLNNDKEKKEEEFEDEFLSELIPNDSTRYMLTALMTSFIKNIN